MMVLFFKACGDGEVVPLLEKAVGPVDRIGAGVTAAA